MGLNGLVKTLSAQALTGASAPTAADDGISVSNCSAVCCVISADSGATISGGTLLGYVYMPVAWYETGEAKTWRWFPHAALNWTPATGQRDAASGDLTVMTGVGRVKWLGSSLTVSAGTTVEMTMCARRSH